MVKLLHSTGKKPIRGLDVGGGIGKFSSVVTDNVEGCRIVVVDNSDLVNDSFVADDNV